MSINLGLSPSQVESTLKQSADDLGVEGWDGIYGYGRINAASAVWAALSNIGASPPTVSITSPASGSIVSGNATVNVLATSSTGIDSVSLSVDGKLVGTDLTSPFSFVWDTTVYADGSHTLEAIATDINGNTSSASNTVTIENGATVEPPAVSISFPSSSTTVSGTVMVQVSATSDVGIQSVTLTVDDQILGTDTASPYEFTWATLSLLNGTHRLTATARDISGNTGSASVTVVVDNAADTGAPSIAITSPKEGTVINGLVSILVSVNDDVGVTKVELYVDNGTKPVSTSTVVPFTAKWNTRKVPKGTHTLRCKAYDAAGNVGYSQVVTVVTTK
jgi:hypothetical protein